MSSFSLSKRRRIHLWVIKTRLIADLWNACLLVTAVSDRDTQERILLPGVLTAALDQVLGSGGREAAAESH